MPILPGYRRGTKLTFNTREGVDVTFELVEKHSQFRRSGKLREDKDQKNDGSGKRGNRWMAHAKHRNVTQDNTPPPWTEFQSAITPQQE